ncbi:MAG: type VI secretion system baseplate subunit TssE [Gemmataceae bacterium]|nr:type VI secretion system baseplate subunit TssE [Gemmataceae bacterium]
MPDANQQGLMPSILDRLIDPESAGTEWRHGYGINRLLEVVRRDLEDLLNTRQTVGDLSADLPRLAGSIYAFGLPELTSFSALTTDQREEIARTLENTIARFEPRLREVRATLLPTGEEGRLRAVHFRVQAKVGADPAPEVAFDTVLELLTGQHSVRPS